MFYGDLSRSVVAFALVACLAAVSIAASSRSGLLSQDQAAANVETTLVPRPAVPMTAVDETPEQSETDPIALPAQGLARVDTESQLPATTPATEPDDPYAWLATVPVSGRTFVGVTTDNGLADEVADFSAAADINPDVVMISRGWANATPDIAVIERVTAAGHLPVLAWEPWNFEVESTFDRRRGEQPDFALSTILAGDHDELINGWAEELAEWGRPVGIRFAHEMNGYWYPWSESVNGNATGQYVAAWRYVYDVFEAAGADNVIWIWSPNPTQPTLIPLAGLYPGDDYVDWIGIVGYLGNGVNPATYVPTFDQLFGPTIAEIREFSDLPLVITEIGATEDGGKKAEWIAHVLDAIDQRQDIIGFIWFEINKETDWRIVSSVEASEAFRTGLANGNFGIPRT
ncbi:MAG: beta-mannanase [Actinobacteria bacterium]|nr:beta-mannanase [Actinomycetota bacterium]